MSDKTEFEEDAEAQRLANPWGCLTNLEQRICEVVEAAKKEERWMTSKEVCATLGKKPTLVCRYLQNLTTPNRFGVLIRRKRNSREHEYTLAEHPI